MQGLRELVRLSCRYRLQPVLFRFCSSYDPVAAHTSNSPTETRRLSPDEQYFKTVALKQKQSQVKKKDFFSSYVLPSEKFHNDDENNSSTSSDITDEENKREISYSRQANSNNEQSIEKGPEEFDAGLKMDEDEKVVVKRAHRIARSLMEKDMRKIRRAPKTAGNLAAFVNDSPVLQNLVKMGADLSIIEQRGDVVEFILKLDFEKDIKPLVFFLHRVGVPNKGMGKFITTNPFILKEKIDDLQVRINYLESKSFTPEAIGHIVHKAPFFLSSSTFKVDARLGELQKQFDLTGDEVRMVVYRTPKLITFPKITIDYAKLAMKDFLGFSQMDLKQVLLAQPKVYLTNRYALIKHGEYVTVTMGLPNEAILHWPDILKISHHVVKDRHEFLLYIKKAQYDPKLPNYISLKALARTKDVDFCNEVAKVPLKDFTDFLKTR